MHIDFDSWSMFIGILLLSTAWSWVKQHWPRFVLGWVTILLCQFFVDIPSDQTLNLALLLRRPNEFPFGINIVEFIFSFSFRILLDIEYLI